VWTITRRRGPRNCPSDADSKSAAGLGLEPGQAEKDLRLQVYLAHYNSSRAEIVQRYAAEAQVINLLGVVLVGILAAAAAFATEDGVAPQILFERFGLLLPLVAAPLAYFFYDNDFAILALSARYSSELRNRLVDITGDEKIDLRNRMQTNLSRLGRAGWVVISAGRVILWLIPVVVPTIYGWVVLRPQQLSLKSLNDWLLLIDTFLSVALCLGLLTLGWEICTRSKRIDRTFASRD
jgi:hypothetical protein